MKTTEQNQQLLIRSMQMSDLDYHNYVMDVAYEYLDHYVGKDHFGKNVLLNSKSFWTWWRIQWNRRNRIFINETRLNEVVAIIQPEDSKLIKELYLEIHTVSEIQVYPNRIVMEQSYAEMIGKVFDEVAMKGGNNESVR